MVDCIIVGSGLAGISAALTLQANGKSFIIFGNAELSTKISKAELIHNYPGFFDIKGTDFCENLKAQLQQSNIVVQEEKVSGVYALNGKFGVATQEGGYYECLSVILACGVEGVKEIEGEHAFLGRGVSYCATCDGFLYKDKTVAVLCTDKHFEHEVEFLADFAKEVYLIAIYKDVQIKSDNVKVLRKMPLEIKGTKRVEEVVFKDERVKVDGVFFLRDTLSPAVLMENIRMQDGHIFVDREMQTNVQGCFACGDCTGRPYQYAKAVGEGNVAAHSVSAYINKQKKAN